MGSVRYYATINGRYYGSARSVDLSGGGERRPALPAGLVEVTSPPPGPNYRWTDGSWASEPPATINVKEILDQFTEAEQAIFMGNNRIAAALLDSVAEGAITRSNGSRLARALAYARAEAAAGRIAIDPARLDAVLAAITGEP